MNIRQSVIKQLDSLYPNIPIYGESIEQNFKQPSFYVKVLESNRTKGLGKRYKHVVSLDVHYFTTSNKDAEEMAWMLYEQLEILEDLSIRGRNLKHEVMDEVLHFFIEYQMVLVGEESLIKMQGLEVNEYAKGTSARNKI